MSSATEPTDPVPASSVSLSTLLGVTDTAVELCRNALFIDLHIDTLIPPRLWGYDIFKRHRPWFGGRFFGHLDVPRLEQVSMDAAMWSITTNPFRTANGRYRAFVRNLEHFSGQIEANPSRLRWIRNAGELRGEGIGVLLSIQGGNALEAADDSVWAVLDRRLTRVTLVHLTNSVYGASNAPVHRFVRHKGLSDAGRSVIEILNEKRVFVDLAHIHPDGFWDALDVHTPDLPPIVTHTGLRGVRDHWRNIDDDQVRAIADRGGVVGVMAHAGFLKRPSGPAGVEMIVEHIEHLINVGGVGVCSIGTDFDGAIIPPRGFRDGLMYPRLVQAMLDRNHRPSVIEQLLGLNFQTSFARLRPSIDETKSSGANH
jgi:membrane dipeptidase